jgi:hypothetical protein
MWEAVALAVLALGGWYWADALRSRERAVAAGRQVCQREGVQFLDDTVVMTKVAPARNADGRLAFRRTYRFEFSDTGNNRREGTIVVAAGLVESLDMEPFLLR